ncbi:prepilin-type N-terminal cleavage/methylation domain-containing protein [Bacillus timonensis]|nr:prepilin-type N-terminal cleavage/methylation domain-containing protein [Bacillus timonensis]
MKPANDNRRIRIEEDGFTLVEVLGVLVVAGILVGIAVPSVLGLIEKTRRDVCDLNRIELEKGYESFLEREEIESSEATFIQFIGSYENAVCPVNSVYSYFDGQVECSVNGESVPFF